MYGANSQTKFKNSMLRSSLCNFSDAYILVIGTITIIGQRVDDAAKQAGERNKGAIFKNFTPFTKCISKINNTQVQITNNSYK